jgi:hypothetical protein
MKIKKSKIHAHNVNKKPKHKKPQPSRGAVEEYDYHCGSAAQQGLKMVRAAWGQSGEGGREIRAVARLNAQGISVRYERLDAAAAPFELAAAPVVAALCEVLALAYRKLAMRDADAGEGGAPSAAECEALLRIDRRIKHHVISPMSRVLNRLAIEAARDELASLAPGSALRIEASQ